MTSFSMRQVRLRPGEEYRDEIEVDLMPIEFGGERYLPVPEKVPAEFVVNRATTGTMFRLAFTARLHGPCYRCLGDAVLDVPIDANEYQASTPETEEMATPYLVDDNVDLSAWARDAIVLALPDKILCQAECAGLCDVCGKNLNDEPHEHAEEAVDGRWAALEALREQQ